MTHTGCHAQSILPIKSYHVNTSIPVPEMNRKLAHTVDYIINVAFITNALNIMMMYRAGYDVIVCKPERKT